MTPRVRCALLLADQDGWASTPPPDPAACRAAVRGRGQLTFREAMDLLAFGPVGTYFAHRWSDPTFLSGLALAEAHWHAPARVVELACGAGHFLREFARQPGVRDVLGADLVFAKLWLARHFVCPAARLACFDAAAPWPLADAAADLVFCHDAFYFLPDKPHVAAEMRRVAGEGRVLVGHAHNAAVENLSHGAPLRPEGYAALFGSALLYDDNELTQALAGARAPRPAAAHDLLGAAAVALAAGAAAQDRPRVVTAGLAMPEAGRALRRNPLYVADAGGGPLRRRFPRRATRPSTARSRPIPEASLAPAHALAGEPGERGPRAPARAAGPARAMVSAAGRLGWGIAGFGWVARDYVAPAIRDSANGRLLAVHDRSAAALAQAGEPGHARPPCLPGHAGAGGGLCRQPQPRPPPAGGGRRRRRPGRCCARSRWPPPCPTPRRWSRPARAPACPTPPPSTSASTPRTATWRGCWPRAR